MIETEPLGDHPVTYSWEWRLAATPEQLWPYVSDTNRMNMLASMAPVRIEESPDPEGGVARTGQAKQLGLTVTWEEHPFEWAFPAGFSVRRDFHNGVLKAYRSSVLLKPDGEGTRLIHLVELIPRLGLMAPFVRREGVKLQRHWEHAYRAVEAYLRGEAPFPFEGQTPPRDAAGLREKLGPLDTGGDPHVAERLFQHVLNEHAHELCHVRPFVLADRWRFERETTLSTCVELVQRALLRPQWSLLCPHCRGAKGTSDTLRGLAGRVHCAACNISFDRLAEDVVELTFRPDVRYRQVEEATFCVGGPGSQPHVCFQAKILPGSGRDVGLTVPPGPYRLRGPRLKGQLDFTYHGAPPAPEPAGSDAAPPPLAEPPEVALRADGPASLASPHLEGAKLRLRLVNETDQPLDVVIETRTWRDDVVSLAWLRGKPELLALLELG